MTACSADSPESEESTVTRKTAPGEILLASDSPKKAYIKTNVLTLIPRPLLEPLVGKITLDESLTSRISSPVAGRVISAPVTLGELVKEGTSLLELSSPDVASAEADYAKAQANLSLANRDYNRQKQLYEGKAAPRKDFELAQEVLNQTQSEAKRTLIRLQNLRVDTKRNDGRFDLRSPISGVVLERNVNVGMEVRPDLANPLYVISDIKKLSLLLEIFEVNLPKIKQSQNILISVEAYPDDTFPAIVKYIGQKLDEETRAIIVRCELPNPEGKLLPGMYATVMVQSEPDDQAIVIPLTAVFTEDESDFVFVKLDDDHYRKQQIKLGLRLKDRAVVEAGLAPGQTLVYDGALMLRAEEPIKE